MFHRPLRHLHPPRGHLTRSFDVFCPVSPLSPYGIPIHLSRFREAFTHWFREIGVLQGEPSRRLSLFCLRRSYLPVSQTLLLHIDLRDWRVRTEVPWGSTRLRLETIVEEVVHTKGKNPLSSPSISLINTLRSLLGEYGLPEKGP